jgi:predicted nuclease of predicted toxin-antitoxin system
MRILFDQGVPLPLKNWLASHGIETARQRGWSELLNGELLAAAQGSQFDLFITTDQNLRHQQDLSRFAIAVLVLMVANWPALEPFASEIAAAVDKIQPRQYVEWLPV